MYGVRVAHGRARLVDERSPVAEDAPRPLLVLAHRQVVAERVALEGRTRDRGVDVREEGRLERELGSRIEALHARLGPVEEVQEEALGRPGVRVGELAAVRSRHVRPRTCRRHEPREPVGVVRNRVLGRKDDRLASRELDAEVARAAVPELLGRDLVHDRAGGTGSFGAAVRRARVDDHDLDLLLDLLRGDPGQAAREVGAAVLDRDDDRDHRGVAARTNW